MEFKKDYQVVAFDLRGFNLSDKPTNRNAYALDGLMEDIEVRIQFKFYKNEDVILQFKQKKCILVSHGKNMCKYPHRLQIGVA